MRSNPDYLFLNLFYFTEMVSLHYDDVSIAIAVVCMLDTQIDILQFSRSSLCTVYIRATYDALFRTYIAQKRWDHYTHFFE